MRSFPFELSITQYGRRGEPERILCKGCLRAIPSNREVYDGEWNGRGVVVKVFSRRVGAQRSLKREWEGLAVLQYHEVNTPEPLFYGRTADGQWAVVTEKVANAPTLKEVFRNAAGKEEQAELLLKVCRELARQHENGIVQKDLHLGNFLLDNEKIVVLDPGQMQFIFGPVGRKKSISQLALLTSNLTSAEVEFARNIWKEYFNQRKWEFGESDERLLWEQMERHKRDWLRRALKKCLRTSKNFLRIRAGNYLAVFDRQFIAEAEPTEFLGQTDKLTGEGESLKIGNTSCVFRVKWKGKDIVIKRYNHKGFLHSLRNTITGSRARKSWLHGHRLVWLGMPTPKPVVYIEERKGPLVWKSYLVTEYVEGRSLYYFLRDGKVSQEQRSAMTRQILEMLEKLQGGKITHRDLKETNLLVTADGPVLTDLDAMKVHKLGWICKLKSKGYIKRFRKEEGV